ncbi:MAG TPA: hypothetical protein VET65_05475 [Candidatus Limnocylindrales bacterium]|nr:hypothetical protein [Candidatus Limnocylindrales bacterium]
MQATYDVRKAPTQAIAITFAVAVSLILGGAGGFALKGLSEASVITGPAPVVVASLAGPMTRSSASTLTRLELQDQQSQAESAATRPAFAANESNHAGPRYGPR